jgi:hypothetical protein
VRPGYLVIVSCGEQKIWKRFPDAGPTFARDAYASSPFTKSRRYAEHFGEHWLILSAKYGFIEPEFIIPADYNRSFYDADAISATTLREQVAAKQLARFETVGVLGSDMYWRQVERAFDGTDVACRHVNGKVSFPAQFHNLVNDLLAHDKPFLDTEDR